MAWFNPLVEVENLLRPFEASMRSTSMPIDAYRRGFEYVVDLDLPGVSRDSIDVTVERNVLRVTAERMERHGQDEQVLLAERPKGQITRSLYLGQDLDADNIKADYADGVLSLTIPVAEQAKPRRVPIVTAGDRQQELTSTAA